MSEEIVGKCRVCGCTDLQRCKVAMSGSGPMDPYAQVVPCRWIDVKHTLCTNFNCLARTPMATIATLRLLRTFV